LSNTQEERKVNDLAAELLLPESIVKKSLQTVPVVAGQVARLAAKARISELAAAIRVANIAEKIGLVNASVLFFRNNQLEWQWSKAPDIGSSSEAKEILDKASSCHPKPARIYKSANKVIVASLIKSGSSPFVTLFVQLLPLHQGKALSDEERRIQLEQFLFDGDEQFRMQVQGVLGYFRSQCGDLKLENAVAEFFQNKVPRWSGERRRRIESVKGQQYIKLRLQAWCR
jgi:hypothetical protein